MLAESVSLLAHWSAALKVFNFFLCWLLLWLPIAIPLSILLKWNPFQHPPTPAQKLPLLATLYLLVPLLIGGFAFFSNQSIAASLAAYGLVGDRVIWQSGCLGFLVAGISLAGMFVLEEKLGWLYWQFSIPVPQSATLQTAIRLWILPLVSTLGLALWVGFTEELVFRGFVLTTLQQDYAPWMAATIASLIFAVLHLVWEGKQGLAQLPGLYLMGMVLSLAQWVDAGNLGLAIGLHAGWVWVIAYLDTMQALHYTKQAPIWLTGRDGNPLTGAMALTFLLSTGLILGAIAV